MRDLLSLPNAHLHVHLESTLRSATLQEIGAANGVKVPGRTGTFGDFASFFAQNDLVRACRRPMSPSASPLPSTLTRSRASATPACS